jgi:arylsulfatase A-like enzyme
LDEPLGQLAAACRKNNILLVVTADHGMCFPGTKGKGGHSSEKYMNRSESLRIPLVFLGPGVEEMNLGGHWSETDIAPTVIHLLNISINRSWEGKTLPIQESYNLLVVGAPEGVSIWKGDELLANATGDHEYNFRGLARGLYTIKSGGRSWEVLMNQDHRLDLADKATLPSNTKRILGVILILAINLVGILVIIRIIRIQK